MTPRKPVAKENLGRPRRRSEYSQVRKTSALFDAPRAHAYSIVARDHATGELRAAVP
jgi:hypothetical protein